jgi:hypothetical protein
MNNNYKFLIKIYFNIPITGKYGLLIEILKWDQNFIWDDIDGDMLDDYYPTFDSKNNFTMFSHDKGYIFDLVFALPSKSNFGKRPKLYGEFNSENERYDYLKGLYECLTEYGNNWKNYEKNNNKIVVINKYWYMQ